MREQIFRNRSDASWTYERLNHYQVELAERIVRGESGGELILSELAPVITLGKRARVESLGGVRGEIDQMGIEVLKTSRGGFATYHGPGQWVLFPVMPLKGRAHRVSEVVMELLEIMREVSLPHRKDLEIRDGDELGLWTSRGKLASVGIQIKSRVLLHGIALNVFRTKESFFGIHPCGLRAKADFLLGENLDSTTREREFTQIGHSILRHARNSKRLAS